MFRAFIRLWSRLRHSRATPVDLTPPTPAPLSPQEAAQAFERLAAEIRGRD